LKVEKDDETVNPTIATAEEELPVAVWLYPMLNNA
jgi:hypothetical protein